MYYRKKTVDAPCENIYLSLEGFVIMDFFKCTFHQSQTERTKNKLVCSETNLTVSPGRFKEMSCFSRRLLLLSHIYVVDVRVKAWDVELWDICRSPGAVRVQLAEVYRWCNDLTPNLTISECWWNLEKCDIYVYFPVVVVLTEQIFFSYLCSCKPSEWQLILCVAMPCYSKYLDITSGGKCRLLCRDAT